MTIRMNKSMAAFIIVIILMVFIGIAITGCAGDKNVTNSNVTKHVHPTVEEIETGIVDTIYITVWGQTTDTLYVKHKCKKKHCDDDDD